MKILQNKYLLIFLLLLIVSIFTIRSYSSINLVSQPIIDTSTNTVSTTTIKTTQIEATTTPTQTKLQVISVKAVQHVANSTSTISSQPGWYLEIVFNQKNPNTKVNFACGDVTKNNTIISFVSKVDDGYLYKTIDFVGFAPKTKCSVEI